MTETITPAETSPEKATTIVLYDCFIANRGKGAKGTRQSKSFGIPKYAKDAKPGDAAIDFDFETVADSVILNGDLLDQLKQVSGLKIKLVKIGILSGLSEMIQSETKQAKSEFNALVSYIKEQELHKNDADAEILAKAWQDADRHAIKTHDVPTAIEIKTANRKRWIASQIELGLWRTVLVPTTDSTPAQ